MAGRTSWWLGVGTGGTITGVGETIKSRKPDFQCVAVEPSTSPVITQARNGETLVPGKHMIQGIGAGFVAQRLEPGHHRRCCPGEQ